MFGSRLTEGVQLFERSLLIGGVVLMYTIGGILNTFHFMLAF